MWKKFQNTDAEKLLDYDWLYYHYITLQETMKIIGELVGVEQSVVSYYIRKNNIPRRAAKKAPIYTNLGKEWWHNQYVILKKSTRTIALELGVESEFVRNKLIFYNIPRRDANDYVRTSIYSIDLLDNKEWLIYHHITLQLLPSNIAGRLGCSAKLVRQKLTEHNIPIIDHIKRGKKHPNFGKEPSDEVKERIRIVNTGRKHREESIRLMSEVAKKVWQNPERYERQIKGLIKYRLNHPDWLDNVSGPNSCHWRGGISYLPYCPKFNTKFKEQIREKFGRVCYLCGKTEEENSKHLDVHHVDYDKLDICNGKSWSFVPLCHSCHTKTTNHRHYYFNMLINYWLNNENSHFIQFMGPVI